MGPSVKWYFKRWHFNRKRFWASLYHTVPVVSPLWWNKGFSYFEGGKKCLKLANAFFLFFLARKACAVSRLLKNRVGRPLLDKAVNGGSPINQAGEVVE